MDAIFKNSEHSQTIHPPILLPKFSDKINFKRNDK